MKILITGGASGLGGIITKHLTFKQDQQVFFTYNQSKDNADLIEKEYKNCKAIKCNFNNEDDIYNLISIINKEEFDVLINNAYNKIFKSKHFHKTTANNFLESFTSNILPTIKITQKSIEVFRKKKFGKVITIISSAVVGNPQLGWSLYIAEKNYLLSLSKSWATENAKFNISSNTISPGFMLTNFHKEVDERIIEQIRDNNPNKEILNPIEVAKSIEFLINASQQINGINLIINASENVI